MFIKILLSNPYGKGMLLSGTVYQPAAPATTLLNLPFGLNWINLWTNWAPAENPNKLYFSSISDKELTTESNKGSMIENDHSSSSFNVEVLGLSPSS